MTEFQSTVSDHWRGRVGVVTGAASGFGYALAVECAKVRMSVALLDIDADRVRSAAAAIADTYRVPTLAHRVDVGLAADLEAAASSVSEKFGGCDLLFANVGVQQIGAIERLSDEDWAWVLNVNVVGTARTVRSFLPLLRAKSGARHIALTASSSALVPAMCIGAYQASKSAVTSLGDTLRLELENEGISVTVIFPAGMTTRHLESSALARPAELGESITHSSDIETMIESLAMTEEDLTTPEHAARNVLESVTSGEPYVVTHGGYASAYEARYRAVKRALDRVHEPPEEPVGPATSEE
jgi:NAD(P)-dependent dehydrogenase (short-subunit alcohol dehydrogenase family)